TWQWSAPSFRRYPAMCATLVRLVRAGSLQRNREDAAAFQRHDGRLARDRDWLLGLRGSRQPRLDDAQPGNWLQRSEEKMAFACSRLAVKQNSRINASSPKT